MRQKEPKTARKTNKGGNLISSLVNYISSNPIPVAQGIETFTKWLTKAWSGFFRFLTELGNALMNGLSDYLNLLPVFLVTVLLVFGAYIISGKKKSLPVFTLIGLLYILNQGLWGDLMNTVTIVLVASFLAIIQGVPLGILCAKSRRAEKIITPILDFMQTMPSFVYLIPAVAFFGIGRVPGVFASVIFALPPTVRMTSLGIKEIPEELSETAKSFGCTGWQKLIKVELPLAKNTIMAGINQTNMLSLSMVVTASMIGAPGLGAGVLTALQKADVGMGFVYGIALVVLAIVIDRYTQSVSRQNNKTKTKKEKKKQRITAVIILIALILGGLIPGIQQKKEAEKKANMETIKLAAIPWDSERASTEVLKQVLEKEGFNVEVTTLDVAVVWESISNGDVDASSTAWLPVTQKDFAKKHEGQYVDMGPNLEHARIGLVVPDYMPVKSIEDLRDEAGKEILAIEPGSGTALSAERTQKTYPNLSDWTIKNAATGAVMTRLGQAIDNNEEIVITGWIPHWIFNKYDVHFLDDPKGTMGTEEGVNTICRKGFKKDHPRAYEIIDRFYWTPEDMGSVMLDMDKGMSLHDAAAKWIKNHPKEVAEWVK